MLEHAAGALRAGTDRLLVMVTEQPRDLTALSLAGQGVQLRRFPCFPLSRL